MKKGIYIFILSIALLDIAFFAQGGKPPVIKWKVENSFEQKVLIENKGQYSIQGKVASKNILYGARQGGLQYYFTANSIWIKRTVAVKRTEQEIEALKAQMGKNQNDDDEHDEKELNYKNVDEFHEISFRGANPLAGITSDNEVSWYYNFTMKGNISVKAHAFKKLTYHNLYSGIDMELYFPGDKQGFEYSFIVHPGADVAQIKIQYPLNEPIQLTKDNNIVQSPYGSFTDHAPVSSQTDKGVNCSFSLNNSMVGFSVGDYDKTQNLVIDPWVTVPTFTGTNSAYDVDWDNAGNCYVYGGSPQWQLIKYNNIGAMLWSYTESFDDTPFSYQETDYGGFAVDRNSQSVYIVQGYRTNGAEVVKLNASGAQIAEFSGNPNFREMWRIAFSSCTNQAVIAGGGTSSPSFQACYLDTNITNLLPVNVLNTKESEHDMWGITLDNYGNCYMATVSDIVAAAYNNFKNVLLKFPLPFLAPTTWMVSDGYHFREIESVQFTNYANGFNGMTISNTDLYTYDSYTLKKWNSVTGAAVDSVSINIANEDSLMRWGGLTSDQCDDIFIGDSTNIQQYDGNLNLVNTITGSNMVYDVKLALNDILYACGAGFVEAIRAPLPNCYVIKSQNLIHNPTCLNPSSGSDTLTISGGVPPYSVTWNTTPVKTGDTVSNLSSGNYIAEITDRSCPPDTSYDTITLNKFITIVGGNNFNICSGDSIGLTITDTIGKTIYAWSPSTGLSSTSDSSVIAKPAVTTTYTVIATTLGGCSDTAQIVVKVNPLPVISVTPDKDTICPGQSASIITSGAYTYTWSPSIGLSASTGSSVIVSPPSGTTYTITGIDYNGCKNSAILNIGIMTLIVSPSPSICTGQSVLLTANGMNSYEWYPPTGLNSTTGDSVLAKPASTTTYTVTGSANNGCPNQALQVIVTVNPLPVIQVTPAIPSICFGQSITWNVSGAEYYTWSPSMGLSATTGANVTLNPASTATYFITGIDSIGCSDTITAAVYIDSLPSASFVINPPSLCNSQQIKFTNTSTGASTYLWDFGDGTTDNSVNPLHNYSKGGLYVIKLMAITASGCLDTTTATDSIKSVNYGIHIANAFAPGSVDEGNNIFKPEQILCSENSNYIFRIYSRWGELVYETTDLNQGWDGTYKGKMEPIDVYVYYIQYNCGQCIQFIKGNVTLLK